MLMTIKNKMLLGMDKLIEETKKKGGVPANISLDVQEAADFLREVRDTKIQTKKHLSIKRRNEADTDVWFMLRPDLTKDELGEIIKQWYRGEFTVYYKTVEIKVAAKKKPNVPMPVGRLKRFIKKYVDND